MKYFNSDGKEGTMCGNGGRCFTAFAKRLDIIDDHIIFSGIDGSHEAFLLNNNEVRLRMIDVDEVKTLSDGYLLDTGSKHFVLFRNELEGLDVRGEGKKFRHESRFGSDGTNVNFVNVLDVNRFEIRTFERGVEDETLACGTGAVASAISAYIKTGTDKSSFEVLAKGGQLHVNFDIVNSGFKNIWLEGPTQFVFSGNINLNAFR
jgi:diaminopimelate epimerase